MRFRKRGVFCQAVAGYVWLTDCQQWLLAVFRLPDYTWIMSKTGGSSMKFNEKLLELRKRQGLSQEELGMDLQVSRQTVSKWEAGVFQS